MIDCNTRVSNRLVSNRWVLVIEVLATLGLLVGSTSGCATSSTPESANAPSTTSVASSAEPKITPTSSPEGADGGLGADCLAAAEAFSALVVAPIALQSNANQAEIEAFRHDVETVRATVPPEINQDAEIVVNAYSRYVEVLAGLDFGTGVEKSSADDLAKLDRVTAGLTTADVEGAQDRINTYFATKCGN